jgi:hypothetical protein
MAIDEKVLKKIKKISNKKDTEETLRFLKQGLKNTEETLKLGDKAEGGLIPEEIMKDLLKFKKSNKDGGKQKLKDGKKTDFGMLSVKKGIDKNPKPTKADRIAGATKKGLKSGDSTFLERRKKLAGLKDAAKATVKAKDGSRTKVRGVRIANKGFRKARMS